MDSVQPKRKKLNIFDFDGTLFRSPVPNQELWEPRAINTIKSTTTGLGWFQNVLTLSPPYVPEEPPESLFVQHVKSAVQESMADIDSVTVLLTGRSIKYAELITNIVTRGKLLFDHIGLKPTDKTSLTTMNFKLQFIVELSKKYNPLEITLWEDRPNHADRFSKFFRENFSHVKTRVIQVKEEECALPHELELDLVMKLNSNLEIPMVFKQRVSYTAIFLSESSRKILMEKFPPTEGWKSYYHHVTICLGSLPTPGTENTRLPNKLIIGSAIKMKVVGYGRSNLAYAAQVEVDLSVHNKIPHVTLCVSPDGKPHYSNSINLWSPLADHLQFQIEGVISEKVFYDCYADPECGEIQRRNYGRGSRRKGGRGTGGRGRSGRGNTELSCRNVTSDEGDGGDN